MRSSWTIRIITKGSNDHDHDAQSGLPRGNCCVFLWAREPQPSLRNYRRSARHHLAHSQWRHLGFDCTYVSGSARLSRSPPDFFSKARSYSTTVD